ncbi:aldehyde dehydrogenase family protein [Sulfolobus acidocaldarius]|uniref:aldehyde dehydrogenase family protein n=1 Tax=Sulfolobus acidocaldarius TaxID=2285 RepID=UPI0011BEFA93|nr:aldehyde dehydrogenase family protein [Sulfolobus acidocaldarius]
MAFVNERTYQKYLEEGREEEFHKEFDKAVNELSSGIGKEYPLIIGKREIRTNEKIIVTVSFNSDLRLGIFQKATENELNEAIETAENAYKEWQYSDWKDRVEIAMRAAELMARHKFALAATITFENGKNRYEAMAEVDETIDYLRYYAYLLEENRGYIREMESRIYKNEKGYSVMRPYGTWFVVSPFNFPLAITATMTLGSVLTGNTAIVKPSSDTPLSAYNLIQILRRAGLPDGVVNYLTGKGSEIVTPALKSKRIAGLAFTGSKDVGHKLAKDFLDVDTRPIVMELGGKNAVIVTDKANIDKAVEGVFRGAFGFGGQKCSASSRIYVETNVYDTFLNKLVNRIKEAIIGDPTKKETFLGPLINSDAVSKYVKFVEEAKKGGGEILYGGEVIDVKRRLVKPTIVSNLPLSHWLWKTELFVPIILVTKIGSLEEGVKLANDVEYGLTAGIFSEDQKEIEYFFNKIEAGVVYANRMVGATTGAMPGVQPFGGWKHSGWTGKNAGGPYYLLSFMREQARTMYT